MDFELLMDDYLLNKARKYCAANEHCKSEVAQKLTAWGATQEMTDDIISRLEDENFIAEQRFAELFTRSKINQNKWGVVKIELELERRNIPVQIIRKALSEIDQFQYLKNLEHLVRIKSKELKENDPFIRKQKLMAFLSSKGYEPELLEHHFE
ncbi:MAG: RecX family transcriptional regulator [Bacteroidales bacterium]|nr:RecX family transcriptional regulator [Bacteroidales bacterium]